MRVLSFDCANRSLAVCFMSINLNTIDELDVHNDTRITNHTKIHMLKVFDLTRGEKMDTVHRTALLKECLNGVDQLIITSGVRPDQVLVEYQMSVNDKSRCVSNGILYHYSCVPGVSVSLVGPTLKNKICFSEDETLEYGTFIEKYASKYTANKNHSKANFLYWLDTHNLTNLVRKNNIEKKNIDDIADAFMQIWGWLKFGRRL
jgi:hypothetical protein